MKNKYLTKLLCISLASAMVLPSTAMAAEEDGTAAYASEFGDDLAFGSETPSIPDESPIITPDASIEIPEAPMETPEAPVETPIPDPTDPPMETPVPDPPIETPTPEPEITPTPGVTPIPDPDVSPTPSPEITPTPGVTPDPGQDVTPEALAVINLIGTIRLEELTKEDRSFIQNVRYSYEQLSDEEKATVLNYDVLVEAEQIMQILDPEATPTPEPSPTPEPTPTPTGTPTPDSPFGDDGNKGDFGDDAADDGTIDVQTGTPVYYTNMVSNIHAGKEFYLDSLKENYGLEFSDDFADVMEEIEKEYKSANKLTDESDRNGSGVTTSKDTLLVRNWQDILAIYVYEEKQADPGLSTFSMNREAKSRLAEIFAEMNPVVRDREVITKVYYGDLHINDYIKKNDVPKEDRQFLKKYLETDCKLLCAVVTASPGFVRESVGENVSEERVNVIAAAYSLVGKIGYFWGGKSNTIGMDPSWGTAAKIEAEGSSDTGAVKAYGLDCSGFVTWAVINGYEDQAMESVVGHGTSSQWVQAQVVSESEAQPGDLVFLRGPEGGSDNHVGIISGQTDTGDWIAVHCSASANGVTVGEAYGAGFRYIRQPSFYPSQAELNQIISEKGSSGLDALDENTLQALLEQESSIQETDLDDQMSLFQEQQDLSDDTVSTVDTDIPAVTGGFVRTYSEEEEEQQQIQGPPLMEAAEVFAGEEQVRPIEAEFSYPSFQQETASMDMAFSIQGARVATFAEGE